MPQISRPLYKCSRDLTFSPKTFLEANDMWMQTECGETTILLPVQDLLNSLLWVACIGDWRSAGIQRPHCFSAWHGSDMDRFNAVFSRVQSLFYYFVL